MEKVGFLLNNNKRIECLLNPEDIEMKRESGGQTQESFGAGVAGSPDPFQRVSGGTTTLSLKLLFDTSLNVKSGSPNDVRVLTEPLWEIAESLETSPSDRPVRFMWGKNWNIPGAIKSLSEKLEHFTQNGVPRRSWITLEFMAHVAPQSIRKTSLNS